MTKREIDARELLIEAATALIRENGGTGKFTTRDIAARAGVGVGLVNYHFQTKERLVNLCTQRIIGRNIGLFDGIYKSLDMDAPGKLRYLVKENLKFLINYPGISWTSITNDLLTPGTADNSVQTMEAYLPVLREVCGGGAADSEIRVLLHTLISSMQVAFLRGAAFAGFVGFDLADDAQRDKYVDMMIDIVFHKYL